MGPVELTVVVLMAARLAAETILGALNRVEIRRNLGAVPRAFDGVIDLATHRRAAEYSLARSLFGQWEMLWHALVLAAVVFSGVLPGTHAAWVGWLGETPASDAAFLVAVGLVLAVTELPFEAWSTFRLEARFGFNRATLRLWVVDRLKGAVLAVALGFPLLWLLLALVDWAGRWWWVWGCGALLVFQLAMVVLYPKFILRWFNKLTPLPPGELRDRLLGLAERTGFRASTIEVIDGSKRSGHSNAFFTGFGRFRRIVLFDTLVEQLTPEELSAVLAHEIGHYRRGHIPRLLALGAALMLAGFGALAWLAQAPWFLPAFGFAPGAMGPAFLLFALLGGLATYWLTPLTNLLSRRHEFEADAFAREALGGPDALVGALRKLAQKNLSNLTPHPWFSFFHYSHPTLVERERALRAT